jgi:hypothetical protein
VKNPIAILPFVATVILLTSVEAAELTVLPVAEVSSGVPFTPDSLTLE